MFALFVFMSSGIRGGLVSAGWMDLWRGVGGDGRECVGVLPNLFSVFSSSACSHKLETNTGFNGFRGNDYNTTGD